MIPCIEPWTNLFIDNNKIKVCVPSKMVIGELTEHTSLMDFWNSREAQIVRRYMLQGNFSAICHGACANLYGERDGFQKYKKNKKRFTENELLLFDAIKQGKEIVEVKPLSIVIAMDHGCNLSCFMCENIHKPEYVISNGIYRLVDELSSSLRKIFFTGGDPFYSGRVPLFIDYCIKKGYNFNYGFFTNGLNVNMELLKRIHLDEIYISIDGVTKKTYEKIRAGSTFEKVMDNLKRILEYRKRNNWFEVKVMCVVMKTNFKEIPMVIELFESMGTEVRFVPLFGMEGHPENIFEQERHLNKLLSIIRKAKLNTKKESTLIDLKILEWLVIKNILGKS